MLAIALIALAGHFTRTSAHAAMQTVAPRRPAVSQLLHPDKLSITLYHTQRSPYGVTALPDGSVYFIENDVNGSVPKQDLIATLSGHQLTEVSIPTVLFSYWMTLGLDGNLYFPLASNGMPGKPSLGIFNPTTAQFSRLALTKGTDYSLTSRSSIITAPDGSFYTNGLEQTTLGWFMAHTLPSGSILYRYSREGNGFVSPPLSSQQGRIWMASDAPLFTHSGTPFSGYLWSLSPAGDFKVYHLPTTLLSSGNYLLREVQMMSNAPNGYIYALTNLVVQAGSVSTNTGCELMVINKRGQFMFEYPYPAGMLCGGSLQLDHKGFLWAPLTMSGASYLVRSDLSGHNRTFSFLTGREASCLSTAPSESAVNIFEKLFFTCNLPGGTGEIAVVQARD